jgi:hypothetical protein
MTGIQFKCATVQIFGNDSNDSKFDSRGNLEEIELWYCLLPFSPESFVLSYMEVGGSAVVRALCYKPGGHRLETQRSE